MSDAFSATVIRFSYGSTYRAILILPLPVSVFLPFTMNDSSTVTSSVRVMTISSSFNNNSRSAASSDAEAFPPSTTISSETSAFSAVFLQISTPAAETTQNARMEQSKINVILFFLFIILSFPEFSILLAYVHLLFQEFHNNCCFCLFQPVHHMYHLPTYIQALFHQFHYEKPLHLSLHA